MSLVNNPTPLAFVPAQCIAYMRLAGQSHGPTTDPTL
jgi:hypothetical protein